MISPLAGEIAPGMPTPTRVRSAFAADAASAERSARADRSIRNEIDDCLNGVVVVAAGRGDATASKLAPVIGERKTFDLRPAEIDADAAIRLRTY